MNKTKEEIAKEYAAKVYPTANDIDAGLGEKMKFNAAKNGFLDGSIWMEATKNEETEKLIEASMALVTALEVIVKSDPVSIGLDEVEQLTQNALDAFETIKKGGSDD